MALLEWFLREGGVVLSWWALVSLAGLAALPLSTRLLGFLPDRGYTLARVVGLLLIGFVFWLLTSFGLLRNDIGSMAFAWLLVLIIGLILVFSGRERPDLRALWREHKGAIITTEILFFVLLLGWAAIRAAQNDTFSTEKPMELAFISAIMRTDVFPPPDPWMAGYAISYYYFGYVISAMLSMLSGVSSTVGFSMTNALLFALTGISAFGVVYNLVASLKRPGWARGALAAGLLGMALITLVGNFQLPLIELPYQTGNISQGYLDFWGTQGRLQAPPEGFGADSLEEWERWWWFRASRVLTDYNLDGSLPGAQPIDEFPQFSFLLADSHPHVLALPFAVAAIGLALNILLADRTPNRNERIFYGIYVGGLIFLNTWDGPIILAVLLGAEALRRVIQHRVGRLNAGDWWGLFLLGATLLAVAIIAYLPFFIGFRSQAAGLVPNMIYPTALQRYFLMFGPLILLFLPFLGVEIWRGAREKRLNLVLGTQTALVILLALLGITVLLVVVAAALPEISSLVTGFVASNGGWSVVLPQVLQRRLAFILLPVLILIGLALIVGRLFPRRPQNSTTGIAYNPANGFALLLIAAGFMLSLVPEFFYLRDNFGLRINTIFKFYYQAWVLFSIAAAFGVYSLLADRELPRMAFPLRAAYGIVLALVLITGLMYPVLGVYSRTTVEPLQFTGNGYVIGQAPAADAGLSLDGRYVQPGELIASDSGLVAPEEGTLRVVGESLVLVPAPTLDGGRWMVYPEYYDVIQCIDDLVDGTDVIVAEAVRDSYNSQYGRIGTMTGIPILLGWTNHERQWRGPTYDEVAGTREQDINRMYTEVRWEEAFFIIEQYGIDYIMFGQTERAQYGAQGEEKFQDNLEPVCQSGTATIYRVGEDVHLAQDFQ